MTNDQVIDMLCRVFDAGNGEPLKWADDAKKALEIAIDVLEGKDETDCQYCHLNDFGEVKPIDRNGDVLLYPVEAIWMIYLRPMNVRWSYPVNFCPICGRMLNPHFPRFRKTRVD